MDETSKTLSRHGHRLQGYLTGQGLDIGCGGDPVTEGCRGFDRDQGDAQRIDEFVQDDFDYVWSSHCLEHMPDPLDALARWWSLVRPGGRMIIVVPHEDLYEQGFWPSIFNSDHRASFRVGGRSSWSPVSIDLASALAALDDCRVEILEVQDDGLDHRLLAQGPTVVPRARLFGWTAVAVLMRILRMPLSARLRVARLRGLPVDQTQLADDRLAQILAVAVRVEHQKSAPPGRC